MKWLSTYWQIGFPFPSGTLGMLLCALTEHHAMKAYWVSGGIPPHILDFGIRWRWVVNFTLLPLYPQTKGPLVTHWIGGWVGPRAGLDAVVKRKISSPGRDSNPRSSNPYLSTIPLSYPGPRNASPHRQFSLVSKAHSEIFPTGKDGRSVNLSTHLLLE
jgi:hypothetical protein